MKTITRTVRTGEKPWVARITNSDAKYRYARSFVDAASRVRSAGGNTETITWELEPGLYQVYAGDYKSDGMRIVWQKGEETRIFVPSDARVRALVRAMDEGKSFDDARQATSNVK